MNLYTVSYLSHGTHAGSLADVITNISISVLPSKPISNGIEPGAVYYEGQEVSFDCSSEGGVPESSFIYSKYNKNYILNF